MQRDEHRRAARDRRRAAANGPLTAFVLVHGAWHGAWCWDELAPLLGGHVEAVDLPGHGADTTPVAGCTLDAYVARVVEALERAPEPAVLVGHSLGGITVAQAAERRPDEVLAAKRLVLRYGYESHPDLEAERAVHPSE